MNQNPKIVLVDAVLTFCVTQLGKREFPNLAEESRQVLKIMGFDYQKVRRAIVVPDLSDPDLYVLSFDLVETSNQGRRK